MAALRSKPQSATELPRFDGQLMNLGGWLRALRQQEHLLPSDLSYFTKTGAQVMNNGKVASFPHNTLYSFMEGSWRSVSSL